MNIRQLLDERHTSQQPTGDQTASVQTSSASKDSLVGQLPPETIPVHAWPSLAERAWRNLTRGFFLGAIAGCTSLLLNVIGSVFWPAVVPGEVHHPLRIIQVFLTFPLGDDALRLNAGLSLTLGCVLYLITGMFYGAIFQFAMYWIIPNAGPGARLVFCSVLGLLVWSVNFYGILIWLQPMLVGGRWVVDLIPWWVAALTHLVFGWTMAVLYPLGGAPRWRSTP